MSSGSSWTIGQLVSSLVITALSRLGNVSTTASARNRSRKSVVSCALSSFLLNDNEEDEEAEEAFFLVQGVFVKSTLSPDIADCPLACQVRNFDH